MADESAMIYVPSAVAHPGETVSEYLEHAGWSQRELARRTGLTPKTISEICNGKAAISPVTALTFEKVLQRPAHFWLNMQRQYDEAEARARQSKKFGEWQSWANRFPISQMKRYGWLEGEARSNVEELLGFFGVSSPDSWQSVWSATNVAYRQTRRFRISPEAIAAWVRATELQAAEIVTADFDEVVLHDTLPQLRALTREPAEHFVPTVQRLCALAGVAVVWVPELSETGISGCARWVSDRKAVIALTLRYKTDDQVWFSFFHEIAHIVLHRTQCQFILDNADEDLLDGVVDAQMQKKEEEANRFASDTLIPPVRLEEFIRQHDFRTESVHAFADALNIGPGLVIGRLQKEGLVEYHQGNTLKHTFEWAFGEGKE